MMADSSPAAQVGRSIIVVVVATQLSVGRRQRGSAGADEPVCLYRTRNITEDATPMTMTTWQQGRRDHAPRWIGSAEAACIPHDGNLKGKEARKQMARQDHDG
jgi:hypothetical protein